MAADRFAAGGLSGRVSTLIGAHRLDLVAWDAAGLVLARAQAYG